MKKIIINEKQKKKLNLLLEDKEGKNLAKARHYLQSNGYSPEQSQQMVDSIRTDIPNSRLQQCKFILGVARLYISGQLSDGQSIAALNKTLKYIASDAHVNEYDNNLNNESLQILVNRFKGVARDDLQQSMDKSNARQLTVNQDYTIVPIDNADEAAKYGKYTSWCVTHDANMYNSYTHNGTGRFYFCLKKGFEKETKVEGEGCPLDSYGLSMIAVSVTMEGEVNTITCRWNHDMGGNDNIMTVEQLEDLLGRNFYQTFKPYTREELHAKGVILFDEVQGLLDSGKKPEEIFDSVDGFGEGFARVKLNDKLNFINRECKLLSNQWFDYVDNFSDGAARVILNDKYNFINKEGRLISNQWFNAVGMFWDGFAGVKLNSKYNLINREGQLLSNQWFDYAEGFRNGVAMVKLNGEWHKINTRGEIVESKNRNKKTIIITEEHKKKIKDSVKVHHDVMLGVAAGDMAGMCEAVSNQNTSVWYRGYNSTYGSDHTALLWLTVDVSYARAYGNRVEEIVVDNTKLLPASLGEMDEFCDDYYDYYEGPDDEQIELLLNNGFNCNYFWANQDSSYCMCLWDKTPIVSRRELSEEEFNQIEKYEGFDNKEYGDIYESTENEGTITLYHGVNIKGLEFNLEHGGFIPRVCSEGGPKAVWLSEKQYGYPFIFQFDIPKSMVSQLSNVDYIYEDAISFDDFNCHLVKTDIRAHYDSFTVVLNILDDDLSKRQFAMFKDLGVVLWKEFKDYPMVLDEYINPFIEKHQSLEEEKIKDEYKLASEPNDITPYYHVVDEAKNYDMNEIGGVNCQLNFDEDEYEEWLNDNQLQNIPEVKNQFIKDYCTYSIEYLTPETFHGFDYDYLSYDEIINKFGQNMGMAMINDCMDGREHSFETLEYVEDTPVDLSNPNEVNAAAKKYMRTVDNPGGVRGFILTDGTVVDAGWDHIACTRIPGVESREHFVKLGNIRFSDTGLEFSKYPTNEQLRTLRMYCEYHQQDTIYVDVIGNKGRGDFTYNGLDYQDLINDLYNYFTHGIKNRRNDFYERKDMSSKKLIIETKTSVGDFDYTPHIKSILKFMDERGYDIKPYPRIIIIDKDENKDTVLITTGNYSPSDMVVRLYVKDRHPKDVLRSFAHEMIHHMQNIRGGKDMDWGTGGNLDDDDILERIEGEAYLQGNLIFRKWTEWLRSKKQTTKALNENVELDELSTDEVDLSSFEIKDQLNPYFWKDGHLDSRIRIKLLDIADDFIDTLGIDYDEAEDVIMTGSLANYNWSEEYSDIDLHIVVDFGLLGGDPKLLKDYFDAKRKLWNELHKDLRIYGFQVELYVQDASEIHASSGVYSLNKDKWLVKPNRDNLSMDDVDSDFVKEVVSQITEQIDGLCDIFNNTNDGCKLRKVGELAKDLFNIIKQERRGSLQKGEKEMVDGNIIFKTLRRNGYMEKLINLINDVYDKSNSI